MFKKMTIKAKVIILLVVSMSLLTIILATFSVSKVKESLMSQNYAMLTSARDSKIQQISDFFEERISDIHVLAHSENTEHLVSSLSNLNEKVNFDSTGKFPIENALVKEATQPNEEYFQEYIKEYEYYDVFLIDPIDGHVIYTAAKESDYGANLITGDLRNSGLGKVFRKVKELKKAVFIDMSPYAPSNNEPAMFLGAPVEVHGKFSGVLVLQISDARINRIMQFRKGYGASQEDYLVGSDKLMRSDSYLDPKGHSLKTSFATGANVDTVASNNALSGESNTEIVIDYNGNPVLSAYSTVSIGQDFKWAIMSEIDESEVLEVPNSIRNIIIIISIVLLILVVIGSVFIINNIVVKRLLNFQNGLVSFFSYVNRESDDVKELDVGSIDEIGIMTQVVNENIIKAKKSIEEDRAIIDETILVLAEFEQGDFRKRINTQVYNPSLNELKVVLNNMGSNLEKNISNILNVLDQFSSYNYLSKVDTSGVKEHLHKLGSGVNSLGSSITEMLIDNKKNGLIIDSSSDSLLSNVDMLNQASNEAAASLEETAAALEEITGNVSSTSHKITQMSEFAKEITTSANQGEELASKTTAAMDEINTQVTAINDAITVIDQIAFQTNILSLNAAVEAATAGEAGKGFAVVAQEVRNLASRSADAAKEIKELVENANTKANEGKTIADKMIEGYVSLNNNIEKTTSLIADVSTASKEQENGIVQINDAVNSLDQQTQKNASVASETKDIALDTSTLAKQIVSKADEKEFEGKNNISVPKSVKKDRVSENVQKEYKQVTPKVNHERKEERVTASRPIVSNNSSSDDEWESF